MYLSTPHFISSVSAKVTYLLTNKSDWTSHNHLKLNLSKIEPIILPLSHAPSPELSLKINDAPFNPSRHARVLGGILDSDLSF